MLEKQGILYAHPQHLRNPRTRQLICHRLAKRPGLRLQIVVSPFLDVVAA